MKCAVKNCFEPTRGKSKYCRVHKSEARQAWLAMIRNEADSRDKRESELAELFQQARVAGESAGQNAQPVPMVVAEHADPMDDESPVKQAWLVNEGVCGFA